MIGSYFNFSESKDKLDLFLNFFENKELNNPANRVKCEQCNFTCVNDSVKKRNLDAHHCTVRDKYKSGAYHWFTIDSSTNKICTIYFGFSEDLLESLRFLSLPTHYAIGVTKLCDLKKEHLAYVKDSNEPTLTSKYQNKYVEKINQAFNKNTYIYLNYLSLDSNDDDLGSSQHAENVCIGYAGSNADDFDHTYFLNKIESDKQLNTSKFPLKDFKFYMDKTVDD